MNYQQNKQWQLATKFTIQGNILSVMPFGGGHINDTFKVTIDQPGNAGYILQRINSLIFNNIEGLMNNMMQVLAHLKNRTAANSKTRWVELIPAKSGKWWIVDEDGSPWRMMTFIDGSLTYDLITDELPAERAGAAFGIFQRLLSDLPAQNLVETIPNFHLLSMRLNTFEQAVINDTAGRKAIVETEIDFIRSRAWDMGLIERLGKEGKLPLRITHNDTKVNNILFNAAGDAISIIDLDTVMPGYVLYDFGDAIRTGANAAIEDEQNLSKVEFRYDIYKAYYRGYYAEANSFLTPLESELLPFSAKYMTYLIGLRFLTDYLMGDTYYKTAYPDHNLVRARVQFRLLEDMERKL